MQKRNTIVVKILFFCFLATTISCRSTYITEPFAEDKTPIQPNYQNEDNWAVLPSKYTKKLKITMWAM